MKKAEKAPSATLGSTHIDKEREQEGQANQFWCLLCYRTQLTLVQEGFYLPRSDEDSLDMVRNAHQCQAGHEKGPLLAE